MKESRRKYRVGSVALQKSEPATANSQRITRQQKAKRAIANRKPQKTNAGIEAKRKNVAESPADQKVDHPSRVAEHKEQRQERLDRRRQSIIDPEDLTPPSNKPRRKAKTSAASPTDQSKASSNTPRARHTEENLRPTTQTPPTPNPATRRSSLDHLIETAPEAHKDGYRAMKYSYKIIHLTHAIQSENPGVGVFDGMVKHLNTIQNELDRIIEQSRRNYDAEVDQDRILRTEKDGKCGKMIVSEDGSGAPVNTRARKGARR